MCGWPIAWLAFEPEFAVKSGICARFVVGMGLSTYLQVSTHGIAIVDQRRLSRCFFPCSRTPMVSDCVISCDLRWGHGSVGMGSRSTLYISTEDVCAHIHILR